DRYGIPLGPGNAREAQYRTAGVAHGELQLPDQLVQAVALRVELAPLDGKGEGFLELAGCAVRRGEHGVRFSRPRIVVERPFDHLYRTRVIACSQVEPGELDQCIRVTRFVLEEGLQTLARSRGIVLAEIEPDQGSNGRIKGRIQLQRLLEARAC